MADTPTLLKTHEVAEILRVTRQTVNRWVAEGLITPVAMPGRDLRFRREDVERMLQPRGAA